MAGKKQNRSRYTKPHMKLKASARNTLLAVAGVIILIALLFGAIHYTADVSAGMGVLDRLEGQNLEQTAGKVRDARTSEAIWRMEEEDIEMGDLVGDAAFIGPDLISGFQVYGLIAGQDVLDSGSMTIESLSMWDDYLKVIHPDILVFAFDTQDLEMELPALDYDDPQTGTVDGTEQNSPDSASVSSEDASEVSSGSSSEPSSGSSASDSSSSDEPGIPEEDLPDQKTNAVSSKPARKTKTFAQVFETQVDRMQVLLPSTRIVVNGFFDPYTDSKISQQDKKKMETYNKQLKELCEKRSWTYVDNTDLNGIAGSSAARLSKSFYETWLNNITCTMLDLNPLPTEKKSE